jgi:hypothetical protein
MIMLPTRDDAIEVDAVKNWAIQTGQTFWACLAGLIGRTIQ